MRRDRRSSALIAGAAVVAATALGSSAVFAQVGAEGVDFSAVAGTQFTTRVATFGSSGTAEEFDAQIDWGDGSPLSEGTVTQYTAGCPFPDISCFEVRGTHTYANPDSYPVETDIAGPDGGASTESTATVTAPPAPSPSPPPPPQASLQVTEASGGLVVLDAGGSTGDIKIFQFDLDGNGSYETKCNQPTATAVYTQPGQHTVGLYLPGVTGGSATTSQTVSASAGASFKGVTAIGACGIESLAKLHACPTTLRIGVAELSFPAGAPADSCFKFARLRASSVLSGSFGAKQMVNTWRAPVDATVEMNGFELDAYKSRIVATAAPSRVTVRTWPDSAPKSLKKPIQKHGVAFFAVPTDDPGRTLIEDLRPLDFEWDISKPSTVDTLKLGGELLHMNLGVMETPLQLTSAGGARFSVRMALPDAFFAKGTSKVIPITTESTGVLGPMPLGVDPKALDISFKDVPLGGLFTIKELTIKYSEQPGKDVWEGNLKLEFPPPGKGFVAGGGVRFENGDLVAAKASIPFGIPGVGPIGCCVFLRELNGGFGKGYVQGGAKFATAIDVFGTPLASADTTVTFHYSPFKLTAAGTLYVVGRQLSNASITLTASGGSFEGHFDHSFLIFSVKGDVWAGVNNPNVAADWYVVGYVEACVDFEYWHPCGSATAAASSVGITACIGGDIGGGGYYQWDGDAGPYWGCSWDELAERSGLARAAQSGTVRLERRLPRALFRFRGQGAPPLVEVTAPDGRRFVTPAEPGPPANPGESFWVRESGKNAVYLVVRPAPAGRWSVRALPGSAPLRDVATAGPLPRRVVRARVSGRGRQRVLHYRVARVRGQRVTFHERGSEVSRRIGVARGRRGKIRFRPADAGPGRRLVQAEIERNGLPAPVETVARFRAPRPLVPSRPRVGARRSGSRLALTWRRARHAWRYRVRVRMSDGEQLNLMTRRRRLRVGGLGAREEARVSVVGVAATGRSGRAGRTRLRALPALRIQKRLAGRAILRGNGFTIRCAANADGRCQAALLRGTTIVARGSKGVRAGRAATVRVKLTRRGRRVVRRVRARRARMRLRAVVPGTPERIVRVRLVRRQSSTK